MDINNVNSPISGGLGEVQPETDKNQTFSPLKKELPKTNAFDKIAAALNFILTFLLIRSVCAMSFSWRTTATYIGFFILASFYIAGKNKRFNKKALLPGLLAVTSSFSFALHFNVVFNAVVFVMIMFLSGVYCIELTGSNVHSEGSCCFLLDVLYCEVIIPLRKLFLPLSSMIASADKRAKKSVNKKKMKIALTVLFGVLLAIPVLAIVIPLLIDSDIVFEGFFGSALNVLVSFKTKLSNRFVVFFDGLNEYTFLYTILLVPTVLFSPYIFSVMFSFRHGVCKKLNGDTSAKYAKLRAVPTLLVAVFLGVISLVYAIYLLTQGAYFFGAFTGRLPGGIELTITEYARRGFFELVKIALINFVLVAMSIFLVKRENGKISAVVKWLDLFLCVFTVLLSVISISKIILYIGSYGLTEKRLYVFAADIAMIGIFTAIILRLFIEKFPYMKVITVLCCTVITVLGILGVDNIIANYNTNAYLSGKHESIDCEQLYQCSDAGFVSLYKITMSDKKTKEAENCLFDCYSDCFNNFDSEGNIKDPLDIMEGISDYDEYKAMKTVSENYKYFWEHEKNYRRFDVNLDTVIGYVKVLLSTKAAVKSIEVSDNNESQVVENAIKSNLYSYGDYEFYFDTHGKKEKYEYKIVCAGGKEFSFKTKSNVVWIYDNKDGTLSYEDMV